MDEDLALPLHRPVRMVLRHHEDGAVTLDGEGHSIRLDGGDLAEAVGRGGARAARVRRLSGRGGPYENGALGAAPIEYALPPPPGSVMSEYEVQSYKVEPVEGDDQIAVTIFASDGNKWEYGIPFSRATGRYTFEEIDVLAMDFGEEFAEELTEKIDEVMERITGS